GAAVGADFGEDIEETADAGAFGRRANAGPAERGSGRAFAQADAAGQSLDIEREHLGIEEAGAASVLIGAAVHLNDGVGRGAKRRERMSAVSRGLAVHS